MFSLVVCSQIYYLLAQHCHTYLHNSSKSLVDEDDDKHIFTIKYSTTLWFTNADATTWFRWQAWPQSYFTIKHNNHVVLSPAMRETQVISMAGLMSQHWLNQVLQDLTSHNWYTWRYAKKTWNTVQASCHDSNRITTPVVLTQTMFDFKDSSLGWSPFWAEIVGWADATQPVLHLAVETSCVCIHIIFSRLTPFFQATHWLL